MYHSLDGLFFARTENGGVRIVKTRDQCAPGPDNIVCDVTLPENIWASAVCSVSACGEDFDRWEAARLFHNEPPL